MTVYSGGWDSWRGDQEGSMGKVWDIHTRSGRGVVEFHCAFLFGPDGTNDREQKAVTCVPKAKGDETFTPTPLLELGLSEAPYKTATWDDNAGSCSIVWDTLGLSDTLSIKFDNNWDKLLYWNITPGFNHAAGYGVSDATNWQFRDYTPWFATELEPWKSGASPATVALKGTDKLRHGSMLRLHACQVKTGAKEGEAQSLKSFGYFGHFVFNQASEGGIYSGSMA